MRRRVWALAGFGLLALATLVVLFVLTSGAVYWLLRPGE